MAVIEIVPESIQLIKMTDEEYFSEKYKDYISNSKLGLLNPEQDGSMELYTAGFKSKYSDSFELGSVVHAMLLQSEYYRISDIRKPNSKLGIFADKVYEYMLKGIDKKSAIEKASIDADYYAGKLTDKRLETALASCEPYWEKRKEYSLKMGEEVSEITDLYISEPIFNKFSSCMEGVNNSKIKKLLYPESILSDIEVYNEYAILAEIIVKTDDKEVKLKIKAKLDNFTIDHESETVTLNDLKTTGKPVGFFMGNYVSVEGSSEKVWYDGSFQKYHYHRQMGLYLWLLNLALYHTRGLKYKLRSNMLVIETIPEYKSRVYAVNKKQITKGLADFKKLIMLIVNNE